MTNRAIVFWPRWLKSIFWDVHSNKHSTEWRDSSNISIVQRIALSWTCPICGSFCLYWMIPASMQIRLSYHDKKHSHLNMPVKRKKKRFWPLKSLSTSFMFHSFTVKIQQQPRLSWGTVLEEVSENILSPLWSTPEAGTARIQVRKRMKIVDVQWFECML